MFKSAVSLKAVIYRAKRITLMTIQTSMAKMTGVLLGLGFDVVLNRRYPSVQHLSLARWGSVKLSVDGFLCEKSVDTTSIPPVSFRRMSSFITSLTMVDSVNS